jgi:nucleoside phosphorylase
LSEKYPLRHIISTGVAGALSPELKTGDIVIGEKVLSMEGGVLFSDRIMVDICNQSCNRLGMRYFLGVILTESEFVTSTDKKASLNRKYGAMAVEMESAFIAEHAAKKGIPFLAVKAISDRADTCFNIDFQRMKKGGRGDSWKSLKYFSLHPILYIELRKHKKNLAMAVSRLRLLIEEIIDQLNSRRD